MGTKRVLIISYYFPPNHGVGSRRWAKYGKVLQHHGIDVTVLAAESQAGNSSPWDEDIQDLEVIRIPALYPAILDDWNTKGLLNKIKYKLADRNVKKKVTGMPYDRAAFWKDAMIAKATEIISNKGIDTVIVSTPPHRAAFYALSLKDSFPSIDLMVDLRDPWMWGAFREYPNLTGADRAIELQMCDEVIQKADVLIVPVEKMKTGLTEMYPDATSKVHLLSSAFDLDDFKGEKTEVKASDKMKFIYFGSLYDNLEDHFTGLAKAFQKHKDKIELHIYAKNLKYQDIFLAHDLGEVVFYHDFLPSNELFNKVKSSDFVFLFKPYEYGKDNVSTKYFEIINARVPVFLIAEEGMASRFISDNKLGIHTLVSETEQKLNQLIEGKMDWEFDTHFPVESYSFQSQGMEFIQEFLLKD